MTLLPRFFARAASVGLLALLAACRPQIGDSCFQSAECSPDGRELRACDTTMPDGYCTVGNCGADTCADEASCVSFRDGDLTFCMRSCTSDEECRTDDGYACITPDPAVGTIILDTVPATGFCGIP